MSAFSLDQLALARAVFRWGYDTKRLAGEEYAQLLRAVGRAEHRFRACKSKASFISRGLAQKVLSRRYVDRQAGFDVYGPCEVCGGFHIGSRDNLRRKARVAHERQRDEERSHA